MGLDVNTPRGQKTREEEEKAISLWHDRFPLFQYIHTNKEEEARADALLVTGNQLRAVSEIKCRWDVSLSTLFGEFSGEWLVTNQKIIDCVTVAHLLNVPFIGMLWLVDEEALLYKTIWRPKEGYLFKFDIRLTKTQKTVNGGEVERLNAFIPMRDARIIRRADTPSRFEDIIL